MLMLGVYFEPPCAWMML